MEAGRPGLLGHLATKTVFNSGEDNALTRLQNMEVDIVRVEKIWPNKNVQVDYVSLVCILSCYGELLHQDNSRLQLPDQTMEGTVE